MINPYQASDDLSVMDKSTRAGNRKKDAISLAAALGLICAAPVALLGVYLWLPRDPPLPPGVWFQDSMNADILGMILIAHHLLTIAGVIIIWLLNSKPIAKIAITLFAVLSVPAMWMGFFSLLFEKTNTTL
jgi:hypothetical protein